MHTCRNNRLSLRRRSLIALCGALALASPAAQAAKVKVQGEGTISSSDFPSQIAIGDEYSFEFIYDDTTLATLAFHPVPNVPVLGRLRNITPSKVSLF
ncbi:MAG TPA: hypothetical protein VJM53_07760, partial [Burkholderiales bacterium]|nr:hypothetical protein [Burkholderiales bacterium]